MNGAGDANIIFGDGLDNDPAKGIENGKFDILVANPPYAVSAFKAHLKLQHNDLELLPSILLTSDTIETLFVERIGQLLKSGGLAGVFLPQTILSSSDKSGYIEAREQILSNFYLKAIALFGTKTFGATGTPTVVFFMERFHEPPVKKQLAIDTANSILSGNDNSDWNDSDILDEYLSLIGVTAEQYKAFISETASIEELRAIEYFKPYVTEFEKTPQKFPKNYTSEQIEQERKDRLYKKTREVEKEKLIYFTLLCGQETVVITAPSDNAEQKTFLGYDWSNRKGNEGIVLNPNGGYLTNNQNRFAHGTLATFVRNAFSNMRTEMGEETSLQKYVASYRTVDMLDFSKPKFDKVINTTSEHKNDVVSKYPLRKLQEFLVPIIGEVTKIAQNDILNAGKYPVITQETDKIISGYTDNNHPITDLPLIVFGDHSCSVKYIDFEFVRGADGTQLIKTSEELLLKYLFNYLQSIKIHNAGKYERHFKYLKETKIPLPPKDIQQKIIAECAKVDDQKHRAVQSRKTPYTA